MPSRILPEPGHTRGDETSTTSNSPSRPSKRPQIQDGTPSPDSSGQDKSGTEHPQRQSSSAKTADHPSSAVESHRHSQATRKETSNPDRPSNSTKQKADSATAPPQAVGSPLSPTGSYFAPQASASGLEARSPFNKRPPASRSSHGIETLSGPPPALITQRSYQGDSAWRYTQPVDLTRLGSRDSTVRSINALVSGDPAETNGARELDPVKVSSPVERSVRPPSAAMSRTTFAHNGHQVEENQDEDTLKGADFPHFPTSSPRRTRQDHGDGQLSQEDLFLNIAHADSPVEEGIARRRSRISLSSTQPPLSYRPSSARRPNSSGNATSQQRPLSNREHASGSWQSPQALQTDSPRSPRSFGNGAFREHSNANVSKQIENRRYYPPRTSLNPSRARRGSTREPSPDPSNAPDYRISESPVTHTDTYRQPKYSFSTSEQYHSSPINGYSSGMPQATGRRTSRAGGTESTVSTTAPSTVWDELETLKSRINNLEVTGKMPSASGGNALGQRPATAGTTMTTLSSSPQRGRAKDVSLETSPAKAAANNTHPLLYAALERSRDVINTNVYHALETTAADALALAAMTNTQTPSDNTDSTPDGSSTIDRKVRRKADSMCRSLTELCIALADANSEARARSRPTSRDTATISPGENPSFRATSLEPDTTRVSSRAMSRFDARRASIQALSQRGSSPVSPAAATPTQAYPTHQPPYQPLSRPTSIRRRTDDSDRPLSRAMTEAGNSALRPSPREYTSQHPLPSLTQRSPSVHSSLPQRKSYFSTPSYSPITPAYSPITPATQSAGRRYLETSTPPSSESLRLAQARRQQRLASQGVDTGGGGQQKQGLFSRRTRPVELGPGS